MILAGCEKGRLIAGFRKIPEEDDIGVRFRTLPFKIEQQTFQPQQYQELTVSDGNRLTGSIATIV
jgi:hypothetical protein